MPLCCAQSAVATLRLLPQAAHETIAAGTTLQADPQCHFRLLRTPCR